MNFNSENILFIGSILLMISLFIGKTSYKFGVPTLILFLAIGMLAGSDGIGGLIFEDPKIAQFIGIVSLNFILFSGGLDTQWTAIKPVLWQGVSLSTFGVLFTAVSLGTFVYFISDFTIYEALLLGAIVSSTDAAAVFSILRSKSLALKSNLRPTLELESGSNDPMAYVLTITFLSLVSQPDVSFGKLTLVLFQQMLFGGVLGIGFGKLGKIIINKIRLDFEGLYPVLMVAIMFLTFSFTDFLGGNGFLAVYLCAVYLGNQDFIHKKTILKFYDGVAWLMQIVLFLTLGLLVFPNQILPVIGIGLVISLFLMFIARPLGVWLALLPFKMKARTRWYVSWVGLRGAVPIVFATYPLLAGIDKANIIFHIVFFITLTSLLVQGTTLSVIAKWLHVALPEKMKPKTGIEGYLEDTMKSAMSEVVLERSDPCVAKKIVELEFPQSAIIAMIKRNEKFLTPNGSTELMAGDKLIILAEKEDSLKEVFESLGIQRNYVVNQL